MPSRPLALLSGLFVAALIGAVPSPADADRLTSREYFREGKVFYESGDYGRAAAKFVRAYEEYSAHEYLFNIAQAYRKLGDCRKALSYYTRFLDGPANPAVREIAEENAAELRATCPKVEQHTIEREPPLDEEPEEEELGRLVAMAEGGLASYSIGDVNTPVVADLRLAGFYVVRENPVELRLGLSAELNPMSYTADSGNSTAYLSSLQIEGALTLASNSSWRLALELGLGTFAVSSLAPGNPFIDGGGASGLLLLPAARLGLRAELAVGERVAVYVSPAYGYAPASGRFAPDITGFSRLTGVLGLAVRP